MLNMSLSNLLDPREPEQYKCHILLDHLKVDQARRLELAYVYAPDPYTQAIRALDERYVCAVQCAPTVIPPNIMSVNVVISSSSPEN